MSVGNPNRELQPDDRRGLAGADEDRAAPDPAEALQRDAAFLSLFRAGDPSAFGLLFDGWADPVYDRISHQGFTTADVCDLSVTSFAAVHRRISEQVSKDSFRVVVFRSVRQEVVAAADRRVQWRMPVGPYAEDRLAKGADPRSLATDPAVATLLWEAADVLGERVRDVLDLHYRYRFTASEIAAVLNEPTDTIDDILRKLPMGFGAVVRAQVLWRQGAPSHAELAAELTGTGTFDTTTVRLVAGHQRDCATCRETARLHLDPIDVFAAIPAAASPLGMKEVVVEQLVALAVPMTGSVSYRDPATPGSGERGASGGVARPLDDSTGAALAPPPRRTDPTLVARPPVDDGRSVDAAALTAAVRARSTPATSDGRPRGGTVTPTGPLPFAPTTSTPTGSGGAPAPGSAPSAPAKAAAPSLAVAAAFGASAGSSLGGPGAEPSFASPVVDADSPDRSRRWLIVAIGLVVVVAVAIVVVLTKGSGGPTTQSLTATDADRPVITTTSSPASSASTTAGPVTSETPATIDSTPSTVPGSTPTTARLAPVGPGSTAAPPTTAVPFPNFTGTTFAPSQSSVLTGNPPVTLSWNVVADQPVTVVITGPNFSSTALSASAQPVCPVSLTGSACNADPGVYSYVLAATDSLGRSVFSKTIQFTVTPRS